MTILRYTGLWLEEDEIAMVFTAFERYLRTCRKLQATYTLEPAGSKGVWGLEDHQFLNFLWGSSQLIGKYRHKTFVVLTTWTKYHCAAGHDSIRPSSILTKSPDLAAASQDYLFLSSIEHINKLKRGPFSEHSPILHSIATTVPNWSKVNSGLLKMYQAEVLEKHTVVQHFYFGEILPWRKAGTGEALPSHIVVQEKDEQEEEDFPLSTAVNPPSTKAPWAVEGDQHPVSTTVAPWTAMPTGTMPTTTAPWTSARVTQPTYPGNTPVPSSFNGRMSAQNARQGAYSGSAAAMTSPLGIISQPVVRRTKDPKPPTG